MTTTTTERYTAPDVTDPLPTTARRAKILRGIDERSAIALGHAIDISVRALRRGMSRDAVVAAWRARGVGYVLAHALVP